MKPLPCDQELGDLQGDGRGRLRRRHDRQSRIQLWPGLSQPGHRHAIQYRRSRGAKKCKGPHFPLVLSNVFSAKDGKPSVRAVARADAHDPCTRAGRQRARGNLRIGVFGFTPTGIMDWDKRNLDGKVTVIGMVEAAQKDVPELKAPAPTSSSRLSHGGLETVAVHAEDGKCRLASVAGVPGIDAVLLGHSHDDIPESGRSEVALRAHAGSRQRARLRARRTRGDGQLLRQEHRPHRSGAGPSGRPLAGRSRRDARRSALGEECGWQLRRRRSGDRASS